MIKKVLFTCIFLSLHLYSSTINVALAANVSYAINDLIKEFNVKNPNTKVQVTIASSGKLSAQIQHRAPYDIFMSANMKYPQNLFDKNLSFTKPIIYAKGSISLLSKKPRDFSKALDLLKDKSIKKIAIANPLTAPYGKAALEAIKNVGLEKEINKKLIYGQSISQTVTYSITAAQIGIIASSSLYSPRMKQFKKNINWIKIDSSLYTAINQGIIILNRAKNNIEVEKFYNFILSKKAQIILKNYGYQLP